MAVFGAPVAHEDDPERAVRAALAIRDAMAESDVDVRVAVHTGEALVSRGARVAAGEAMVAGDVVNTAARLQSGAPVNGVLVGETTYRATEHAIRYRAVDAVVAKGKSEPVPAWEAIEATARFGVDVDREGLVELVGRDDEVALLAGALERVRREREPQLVTLVGVPGIGKSRLVTELFAVVEALPDLITWRQGRCLPYGDGVSYWALGEMVKAQAGVLDTDSSNVAEGKLGEAAGMLLPDPAEAEWILGHLRPLLGLGGASDADDRRSEAFAAWRRFFEALAEQRAAVLVFEDLHWGDEGLLDFVDHLAEWASGVPLLLVATARPELLERRPRLGRWEGERRDGIAPPALRRAHRTPGRPAAQPLGDRRRRAVRAPRPRGRQPALRRGVRSHAARRPLRRGPAPGDGAGDHRGPPRRPSRRGEAPAPGRSGDRQGVLVGCARLARRSPAPDGGGATPRARAQGVRSPGTARLDGGRRRVRISASAGARRGVLTDPAARPCSQAPSRGRVDRVARGGPGRGPLGAPGVPLRDRPRSHARGRRAHVRPRGARATRVRGCGRASALPERVAVCSAVLLTRARAHAGRAPRVARPRPAPRAGRPRCPSGRRAAAGAAGPGANGRRGGPRARG